MERAGSTTGEVLPGLWRFEQPHPEWSEEDGGEDGWERDVAWWAIRTPAGLVLVDPLVGDWDALDRLVADEGSCAAVVRTTHWHQRSIAEAAARYGAAVWAMPPTADTPRRPFDRPIADRDELPGGLVAVESGRRDEVVLWLPGRRALLAGDVLLRRGEGELRLCPDSWLPPGGPERLRAALDGLGDLPIEHVLASHGPLVLGDGRAALDRALRDAR